ncbi:MAG: glycosyltransferase family 4 protein [Nitrospinae bacterium]|nr:glycosyltransferase family 4 protein [Nitrospinota bacterium]
MMANNDKKNSDKRPTAVIIAPETRVSCANEYISGFEKAGWRAISASRLDDRVAQADLVIMDFEMAANNAEAVQKVPARNLVIDFHYRAEHEKNPAGWPFHLLDHSTVIIHDHEAEKLIREKIRPIAANTLLHPYRPTGSQASLTATGERALYAPAEFSGHPWLDGLNVTFLNEPFPQTVPAGSMVIAPEYSPGVWPLLFWGAGGGLGSVLPASPSFLRNLYYGSSLFVPESEEDFKTKLSAMTRPAPALTPVGQKVRVGVVVPRFGKNAPGGAETLAESMAVALLARGHSAQIITTRTDSMLRWNNNLPEGVTDENGLIVRRFTVDNTDQTRFHEIGHRINKGDGVTWTDETEWLRLSIRSRDMEKYLRDNEREYDCFLFTPYLYGTTYWGVQAAPEKSWLIPCYHREAPAFTLTLRQNAMSAAGLFFNTLAEKKLAEAELGIRNPTSRVIGVGIDTSVKGDPSRFRAKYGVDHDFLLYVGRLQREKNVPQLLDYFKSYSLNNHGGVGLALAGMGDVKIKDDPSARLRNLGFIPEQDKVDAYSACSAFILPSTQESFSIVMMEAWLQGKPVIANASCNVAREHIFTCGGGILYSSADEFSAAVRKLAENPTLAQEMGRKGRDYVLSNFSWDRIMERIEKALTGGVPPSPVWERLGKEAQETIRNMAEGAGRATEDLITAVIESRSRGSVTGEIPVSDAMAKFSERVEVRTEYREFSDRPYFGTILSKIRGAITNHLRKNYIEIFESRQSTINREAASLLKRLYDEIRRGGRG